MLKLPDKEESFWRISADQKHYAALRDNIRVDTVVVGGGIAGLSAAYLLKRAGQTVAVLDRAAIGSGTTGHTTGKVTAQHNLIYEQLRSRLGDKAARVYGQANQAALEAIAQLIKREKINCGFTRADNYVFTTQSSQVKQFQQEAKTAAKYGLPASFETSSPLPFDIKAAVKFSDQAYMNAAQYSGGLAKAINGGGSHVFEHSRAISIRDGRPPHVTTLHAKVTADNVIVATNVPTFPLAARGTYCVSEYPHKSYIAACRVPKLPKVMYISPDSGHYSILPITYKRQSLLLIGGSNHIPGLGFGAKRHFKQLAGYAQDKFQATSVEYIWSARDYIAYDNLPLVGKLYPWSRNLYVITAFRKWGLSNSMAAAQVLHDRLLGRPNQAIEVFNPHRLTTIKSIPHTIAG